MMRKGKPWLFNLSICIAALSVFSLSSNDLKNQTEEKIQSISSEERKILKEFFKKLLFTHGFAYTLFGDKPISVDWFDLDNPKNPQHLRFRQKDI